MNTVVVKLMPLQRVILTCGSAIGALVNPKRHGNFIINKFLCSSDLIATLGEVTGTTAARFIRDRMLASSSGRRVLRSRRRISSISLDLDKLSRLPKTSFGFQHFRFYEANGISPDTRCPVQYVSEEELAYVIQLYRENHDFMHTLCGLSISVKSELALKWFEFLQTKLPMTFIGTLFGPLGLSAADRGSFYNDYLPWAHEAGKGCNFFMQYALEEYLEWDIDKLIGHLLMEFITLKTKNWRSFPLFLRQASNRPQPFNVNLELMRILRQETNLSFTACHEALKASNNDINEARRTLAKEGNWTTNSSSPITSDLHEGAVGLFHINSNEIGIVGLKCKTDFVARSPLFADLGREIAEIFADKQDPEGKSPRILDRISSYNRMVREPIALCELKSLEKLSNNIFGQYLHGKMPNGMGSIAVIVELAGYTPFKTDIQSLASKIASQIAGNNPSSIMELVDQRFLFSNNNESVKEIIRDFNLRIENFVRIAIK